MTNQRTLTAFTAATLALTVLTGCSGSAEEAAQEPPSISPSYTPQPTQSPTRPPTDSERAAEGAIALVRDYFAVVDQLRQRPKMALNALATVATSSQLVAQRRLIGGERTKRHHQVGDTRIGDLKVQSVNLDNSDPAAGNVPTVTIDVCWDVSHADLVNHSGISVVSASRAPTGWTRYTVANYHWSRNPSDGWRIATSQDLEQTPCAAA